MDPQTIPQQTVSGISGGGELSLYQYFVASPLFAGFNDANGDDRKMFLGQYVEFSPALKNFLASTETAITIHATALTYELDDGQIYQIAVALRELITGKIFIKELPITISSRLGIDDIKANEIVNKIISQLFGPIIEDIKRIQRSKFPDKISRIQKESQPAGITQPTARPIPPRPEPATNTQQVRPVGLPSPIKTEVGSRSEDRPPRPEVGLPKPPEAQPQRPMIGPQSQPPPLRSVESIRPPQQTPPRLEVPPQRPEVGLQKQPEVQLQKPAARPPALSEARPEGRQFKIPDLGPLPQTDAQKSLEQELEKVANVIDLRNQK